MEKGRDEGRCKVAQIIKNYELDGLGEELEKKWLGEGVPRTSLRDLAKMFNITVLEAVLQENDHHHISASLEGIYQSLNDEKGETASKTMVESQLKKNGIDVDSLRDDFVSHQAVHTYLTKHRNANFPKDDVNKIETAERAINKLRSRMVAVSKSNLQRLFQDEELCETNFDVFVDVTVYCNECGNSKTINEFLQAGGCTCTSND